MKQNQLGAIDVIVNTTPEELKQELSSMNMGNLLSFKNQFIIIYETQKMAKDNILKKLDKGEITEKKADEVLPNLYTYMQKVEDVVAITTEVVNHRLKASHN